MKLIKFRRQYLITAKRVSELEGWQKETFNGMNVYAEQSLQMYKKKVENKEFLLLGYWINPHSPEMSDDEILDKAVQNCETFQKVLDFLYSISGRFALFCKFGEKIYGVSDAGGFRPIYYKYDNESVNITSNIYMFHYVMDVKENRKNISMNIRITINYSRHLIGVQVLRFTKMYLGFRQIII